MIDFERCSKRFVLQEHKAQRAGLHYDLRIEGKSWKEDKCVLHSWASRNFMKIINGEDIRAALYLTKEHNLNWLDFEGEIEEGYGKGIVKIIDSGKFDVISIQKNNIVLRFKGSRVKGNFAIIKINDYFLFVKVKKNISEINLSSNLLLPYNTFRKKGGLLKRYERVKGISK